MAESWTAVLSRDRRRADAVLTLLRSLAGRPLTTEEAHAALEGFDLPRTVRASFLQQAVEPAPAPVTVRISWDKEWQ